MTERFPFDRDFQIGLLALMSQRNDVLLSCLDMVEAGYFEDKVLVWFYQAMQEYYTKYQEQPLLSPVLRNEMMGAVRNGIIKPDEIGEYAEVGKRLGLPVFAQQYHINQMTQFCRRQACRRVYLETAPLMDSANDEFWDSVISRVTDAANVGGGYLDIGMDYFSDAPDRIQRRLRHEHKIVMATGIPRLDILLGGGLKAGQLGIWLGGTGGGKSIALCHVGKQAIVRGFRVAHYTLELDEEDISARYDASFTKTDIDYLDLMAVSVEDWFKSQGFKYKGRMFIKHYPTRQASINHIKNHLRQMAGNGWYPDLIIIDYGDLLKPTTTYNDEYQDLGAIFADMRGLAGELKVPIWTATQVNRVGLNAEIPDIEHIGDSLKKAFIADIVLAITAKREDFEQNQLKIFLAKNRNGPAKRTVKIGSAYQRMALWDPTREAEFTKEENQGSDDDESHGAPPPPSPVALGKRRPPKVKGLN